MRRLFQDTEHIFRVAALFAAGLLLFLVIRADAVPKDFGAYGHFRARAITENQARPLAFAGYRACEECHTDVVDVKKVPARGCRLRGLPRCLGEARGGPDGVGSGPPGWTDDLPRLSHGGAATP